MYTKIKVKDVKEGTNWSRESEGDISTLKESMRHHGLQQPIIVDSDWNLVAGFRRFRAAAELGWEWIDCRVLEDGEDGAAINLIENLERENLTFYEEALAIRRLYPKCSEQMVADALNRTRGWSRPRIKLWTLGEEIVALAKAGKITPSQVTNLLNSEDTEEACKKLLDKGKVEPSSVKPGKKEIQAAITVCLERQLLDIAQAFRWVLGDINDEEFWDSIDKGE